jgi:type VI secretion system protein VasD
MNDLITRRQSLLFALLALGGCSGPSPTGLKLSIFADSQLNPNNAGVASPLVIKFYELAGTSAFRAASFSDLFYSADNVLKSNLLNTFSVEVIPSQKLINPQTLLSSQTQFLGIVGGYRLIDNASWRLVWNVRQNSQNRVQLIAGRLALSFAAS